MPLTAVNLDFNCREVRRLLYIPFYGESIRGISQDEIRSHILFKSKIQTGELSAAVGLFVSMGQLLSTTGKEEIPTIYLPWISRHMEGAIPDVMLSYAIAFWFTNKVSVVLNALVHEITVSCERSKYPHIKVVSSFRCSTIMFFMG